MGLDGASRESRNENTLQKVFSFPSGSNNKEASSRGIYHPACSPLSANEPCDWFSVASEAVDC